MIKYETTLEEAKEIKKLGFDFSLICEKFFYDPEDGNIWMFHKVYTMSGKEYLKKYDTRQVMRSLNFGAEDVIQDAENEIAIIPYPILGACLPEKLSFVADDVEWLGCRNRPEYELVLDDEFMEEFRSAAEAFIYCAKEYPEDTREQFNKVIDRSTKK